MTEAEEAFAAAEAEIARIAVADRTVLHMSGKAFRALEKLPESTSALSNLVMVDLRGTQVSDIAPLAGLANMELLSLDHTQVDDLATLTDHPELDQLTFVKTPVADLRPLLRIPGLRTSRARAISFRGAMAVEHDPELKRLSEIEDNQQRTDETLRYLETLPEWPAPLPWEQAARVEETSAPDASLSPSQIAQSHISFLLSHAAVSQVQALQLAEQIRFALRDVPAEPGSNQLPDALQTAADVATVLARIGETDFSNENATAEDDLRRHIAALENQIKTLTAQLADEAKAKEAAEALAKANGVWAAAKTGGGYALGAGAVTAVGLGIPTAAVYYLGVDHAVVKALLTVLGRLPN